MGDHITHTGAAMFGRHLFAKQQRLGGVRINLYYVVSRGPKFMIEANPSLYQIAGYGTLIGIKTANSYLGHLQFR